MFNVMKYMIRKPDNPSVIVTLSVSKSGAPGVVSAEARLEAETP